MMRPRRWISKNERGNIMINTLKAIWCEVMHDSAMWPIHGHYACRACGRLYRVPWTAKRESVLATDLIMVTQEVRGL